MWNADLNDYELVDGADPVCGEPILTGALVGASDIATGFSSEAVQQKVTLRVEEEMLWSPTHTSDYIRAVALSAGIS